MIVCEALLCQNGHYDDYVTKSEANCSKAFSKIEDGDNLNGSLKEAFQIAVGDGDPDEPEAHFTSLFDLMTTPPSMEDCDANVISATHGFHVDSQSCDLSHVTMDWNHNKNKMDSFGTTNHGSFFNPDFVMTEHYGPVTMLKSFGFESGGTIQETRYSETVFDGVCVDTGAQIRVC